VSKEGDTFEVPIEIARLSSLVMMILGEEDDNNNDDNENNKITIEILLPNMKLTVLANVIKYCTQYKMVKPSELFERVAMRVSPRWSFHLPSFFPRRRADLFLLSPPPRALCSSIFHTRGRIPPIRLSGYPAIIFGKEPEQA
jgi:hypothetical protein